MRRVVVHEGLQWSAGKSIQPGSGFLAEGGTNSSLRGQGVGYLLQNEGFPRPLEVGERLHYFAADLEIG